MCVLARAYTMGTTSSGDHYSTTRNRKKVTKVSADAISEACQHCESNLNTCTCTTSASPEATTTRPTPTKTTKKETVLYFKACKKTTSTSMTQRAAMALEITTAFEIQIQAQEPLGRREASPLSGQCSRREDSEGFVIVLQTHQVNCPTTCAGHEP